MANQWEGPISVGEVVEALTEVSITSPTLGVSIPDDMASNEQLRHYFERGKQWSKSRTGSYPPREKVEKLLKYVEQKVLYAKREGRQNDLAFWRGATGFLLLKMNQFYKLKPYYPAPTPTRR